VGFEPLGAVKSVRVIVIATSEDVSSGVFPSPVTWAWTCMMPSKRRTPDAWGVRIKCEECMMLVDFTLFRRG
jgi:hypothetical protein